MLPQTGQDPASSLPADVVVEELRQALQSSESYEPLAASAQTTEEEAGA